MGNLVGAWARVALDQTFHATNRDVIFCFSNSQLSHKYTRKLYQVNHQVATNQQLQSEIDEITKENKATGRVWLDGLNTDQATGTSV